MTTSRNIKAAKVVCTKTGRLTAVLHSGSLSTPAQSTVDQFVPQGLQPMCFQGTSTGGGAHGMVYDNHDACGHQTTIATKKGQSNKNRFYRTQLLEHPQDTSEYAQGTYLYNRWGKVGEPGYYTVEGPFDSDAGVKKFKTTFKTKFKNKWEDRDQFVHKDGFYGLDKLAPRSNNTSSLQSATSSSISPSTLTPEVSNFVDLITNEDMFKQAMRAVNIDPDKLPFGMLKSESISAGIQALEALETAISRGNASTQNMAKLSSRFYQAIPQSFGYSTPPTIDTQDKVNKLFELMTCMEQVVQGHELSLNANSTALQYQSLSTDLNLIAPGAAEYDIISRYFENTKGSAHHSGGGWGSGQHSKSGTFHLKHVFRAGRHHEEQRFSVFDQLENRKLLWHGTNVAVVAAILKSGLRIMPHSSGRCGKGIYLADMHEKSGKYCSGSNGTVIMFLVEAPLGNIHEIRQDDSSLVAPPSGYNSIRARGTIEPSDSGAVNLNIDGKSVLVPQTMPQSSGISNSSFRHNEYLVYLEEQHRIRYVVEFEIQ